MKNRQNLLDSLTKEFGPAAEEICQHCPPFRFLLVEFLIQAFRNDVLKVIDCRLSLSGLSSVTFRVTASMKLKDERELMISY